MTKNNCNCGKSKNKEGGCACGCKAQNDKSTKCFVKPLTLRSCADCPAGIIGNRGVRGDAGTNGTNLIPFASGLVDVTFEPDNPLTLTRTMGFGNGIELVAPLLDVEQSVITSGFAFPVPAAGTISELTVSADVLLSVIIGIPALTYIFDVMKSTSQPNPNTGFDHDLNLYETTGLSTTVTFGISDAGPLISNSARSASNINPGSISVAAGDRIAIYVHGILPADTAVSTAAVSFNASLSYQPTTVVP
jgi:hypothetical protein